MGRRTPRSAAPTTATNDSFQNLMAAVGLGAGSQQDGATYGIGARLSRDRQQLENAYRQNWLCGMVVDIIADDMTRAGIEISADIEPEQIGRLTRTFDRLGIWDGLNDAIKWSRLYGGSIAVLLIDGHDHSKPLDVSKIAKKQFRGVYVLDRWQLDTTFSVNDLVTDIGPHLGTPKFYKVLQNATALRGATIHHSRVIRFDGQKMPYNVRQTDNFWGASVLERLYDRLVAFDSTTMGAAQLVYKAHLRTYKVNGLRDIIANGGPALGGLLKQIEMIRKFQSNEGMTLMDATDEFEAHSYTFSGLDNVLLQFGQQLSGATQIPLVRLFGQSPAGLNSSGDSDLRTYYDNVSKEQNRALRTGLSKVLALLCRSELGQEWPEDADFEFRSLWQMTDEQKANVAKTVSDAVVSAENAGIISQATALKELRGVARLTGVFGHITQEDIDGAASEPPAPMDETATPDDGPTRTGDALDANGEHWITLENGEHILLDGSGHVIGGAGGNMNGMKLNPSSKSPDVSKSSASAPAAPERPFDHGELNIPGRTKNINAELDRYKKEQAAKAHAEHKSLVAAGRERKAKISAILGHSESMSKYAAKFGKTPKQIGELIKGMMPKQQDLFIAAHEREHGKLGDK
jgi:hypothetical protein